MIDAGKVCDLPDGYRFHRRRRPSHAAVSPLICNEEVNFASAGIWGSMATWEDAKGARWALTPFWGPKHSKFKAPIEHGPVKYGAIAAFKVEEKAGKWTLAPAWISRDMNRAEPPVIAGGVIFAYGNGETPTRPGSTSGWLTTAPNIASKLLTHAVLYALDAQTGKELWSSGDQITSWSHWGGFRSPTAGLHQHLRCVCNTASALRARVVNSITVTIDYQT